MKKYWLSLVICCFSFSVYADCYNVVVDINQSKPGGNSWDPRGGKPDLKACFTDQRGKLCLLTKDGKSHCKDSFTCDLGIIYFGSSTTLVSLTDIDLSRDDAIASKECEVGVACNLGNAKVGFRSAQCN